MAHPTPMSRRERQLMETIYRLGRASAQEVREALPDPPSYSAVRALLRVLVDKGHLKHRLDGPRYVYSPTVPREKARTRALRQIVGTFFEGSAGAAAATLLDLSHDDLSPEELDHLESLIRKAREEGRK